MSYGYKNRLRIGLSLLQSNASPWLQTYAYDAAAKLATLTSPAGTFTYTYDADRKMLPGKLALPNGAYLTNAYNESALLLATALKNSSHTTLNSHAYSHNGASQRTEVLRADNSSVSYTYDDIGQLKTATGNEPLGGGTRLNEKFGYSYDAAGNLERRTNNALVQIFTLNSVNQISGATRSGTLTVAGNTSASATNVTVNSLTATRYTSDNSFAKDGFSLVGVGQC